MTVEGDRFSFVSIKSFEVIHLSTLCVYSKSGLFSSQMPENCSIKSKTDFTIAMTFIIVFNFNNFVAFSTILLLVLQYSLSEKHIIFFCLQFAVAAAVAQFSAFSTV